MLVLLLTLAAGIAADRLLGEPRRFHPLIGFGRWAHALEHVLRPRLPALAAGALAWAAAVLPWVTIAVVLCAQDRWLALGLDIVLLWFALGARSLAEHAEAIAAPLEAGDLVGARAQLARIVSRDTAQLDASAVARAGTESVLENGNDAVFGTLFWFCVFGGPGALLFRLANTLDAMWGYRNERYLQFGRCAARIDDVLNWLPARLTALTYAALGHTRNALTCWRTQARAWKSPNAGPVMAAGAGALAVELGGHARYHGRDEPRPPLGRGPAPDGATLRRAVRLVEHGMLLWLGVLALAALAWELNHA
jgi:adenosylcobinamide-phosphate synthase